MSAIREMGKVEKQAERKREIAEQDKRERQGSCSKRILDCDRMVKPVYRKLSIPLIAVQREPEPDRVVCRSVKCPAGKRRECKRPSRLAH